MNFCIPGLYLKLLLLKYYYSWFCQPSEDRDLEQIQSTPQILPKAEEVRWLPIRDRTVSILPLPSRVGPMEPQAGGVGGPGLRPRHHRRWHPPPLPLLRPLAGNIPHRRRERRQKPRQDPRTRGSHQPLYHPTQPVGPSQWTLTALQPSDPSGRRHVAGARCIVWEATSVVQTIPRRPRPTGC